MLLCECLSVLAGHCVVWLSDSHSLKFWLFLTNLFATPGLGLSEAAAQIRKTDVALPGGPRKGQAASKINCF